MDQLLYHYSLCIALPLMLFFGFDMLFARVPEKSNFSNFLHSRRLMGAALLILSANYAVHFFFAIRLKDVNSAILANMTTYFLCYWLFSSALMTLLDSNYVTGKRFSIHLILWLAFTALSAVDSILPACSASLVTRFLALLLVIYGLFLSIRLLRTYKNAVKMFENTHSDDIGAYISWLSVFTYLAVLFGVSCALLTFLPDRYIFIWVLSAVPFYIYLYCCYQNYMFFYEKVDDALKDDIGMLEEGQALQSDGADNEDVPVYHSDIAPRIEEWIRNEGYRKPGLTLNELSVQLCTNRTYLSEYINSVYQMTFRDWITDLRIECAKRLMAQNPKLRVQDVSVMSGFLSLSHFSRTFREKEGCSPARWSKVNPE
ncbi:MAG: helix-turn-helix domain-containing protein [Candidatus Cryptobacteroides sp.]